MLEWQGRRREFSHDWLKNQFMPRLASWLRLLDDEIEDPELEREFVPSFLPEGERRIHDALVLVRDFEREMSPRRLFGCPPLTRCDYDTQEWLGEVAHMLWMNRYPIKKWTTSAIDSVEAVRTAYKELGVMISSCSDPGSAKAFRPYRIAFAKLHMSWQALADSIGKFPSEIKVT